MVRERERLVRERLPRERDLLCLDLECRRPDLDLSLDLDLLFRDLDLLSLDFRILEEALFRESDLLSRDFRLLVLSLEHERLDSDLALFSLDLCLHFELLRRPLDLDLLSLDLELFLFVVGLFSFDLGILDCVTSPFDFLFSDLDLDRFSRLPTESFDKARSERSLDEELDLSLVTVFSFLYGSSLTSSNLFPDTSSDLIVLEISLLLPEIFPDFSESVIFSLLPSLQLTSL